MTALTGSSISKGSMLRRAGFDLRSLTETVRFILKLRLAPYANPEMWLNIYKTVAVHPYILSNLSTCIVYGHNLW